MLLVREFDFFLTLSEAKKMLNGCCQMIAKKIGGGGDEKRNKEKKTTKLQTIMLVLKDIMLHPKYDFMPVPGVIALK